SMDSELATATRICGCAGIAMVSGTCETGVAGGAAAANSGIGDTTAIPTAAEASSGAMRLRSTMAVKFFMLITSKPSLAIDTLQSHARSSVRVQSLRCDSVSGRRI